VATFLLDIMPYATKEARNAYHRAYYKGHKTVLNARVVKINKRRRHERYDEIAMLKSAPCLDCGKVPDKDLAMRTGVSRQMVAWYRRKAGIKLTRQGERAA